MRSWWLSLLLVACANPHYADDAGSAQGTSRSEPTRSCFRDGICLRVTWTILPTEDGFGAFDLRTFDGATGEPRDLEAPPFVLVRMPSMGHGSAPTRVARAGLGFYTVSNVSLYMKGDWQIRIQRLAGAEVKDEILLPYTL
jgi:hypothetical protein